MREESKPERSSAAPTKESRVTTQIDKLVQEAQKTSTSYPSIERLIVETPSLMRSIMQLIIECDHFDYEKDKESFAAVLCRILAGVACNFEYEHKRLEIENLEDAKAYVYKDKLNSDGTLSDDEDLYREVLQSVETHVNNAQNILLHLAQININAAPQDAIDFLGKVQHHFWKALQHSLSGTPIWYNLHKAKELTATVATGIKSGYALVADIESLSDIANIVNREVERERENPSNQLSKPEEVLHHWFAQEMLAEADNETARKVTSLLLEERQANREVA